MATKEPNNTADDDQEVHWSDSQLQRSEVDRRGQVDRRLYTGRAINVPDMRQGGDRRDGTERRKVKLIITGRAIDA